MYNGSIHVVHGDIVPSINTNTKTQIQNGKHYKVCIFNEKSRLKRF